MEEQTEHKPRKSKDGFWDFVKTLVIAVVLMLGVRFLIFQPYFVSGSSMEPDFHNGEYILIDELSYRFSEPKRGQVVVFKHPDTQCTNYVENNKILKNFLSGPCNNYIKRIVGLPGETVKIENGQVKIINKENPNGFILAEDYIQHSVPTLGDQEISLSNEQYFVLGDNRLPYASSDSREWGPLDKKYINGKAFVTLFPPSDIGLIKTASY
jgi:signal peptidase I